MLEISVKPGSAMPKKDKEQDPRQHRPDDQPTSPPKPGSLRIRPTRRDAEANDAAFYEILDWAQNRIKLSSKNLGGVLSEDAGQSESKTSRQISGQKISKSKQRAILNEIFDPETSLLTSARKRINQESHAVYFGLLDFLQVNDTSQDNARAAIEGTFQFWRRSVEHPSEFVHGKLVFAQDKADHAVTVTMSQIKSTRVGSRATRSVSKGYFFRVGKHYLMMLQDPANREFRFTYFPGVRFAEVGVDAVDFDNSAETSIYVGRQRHITSMDGYVIGIDYNRCFLSPIYATLVDDVDQLATLDSNLDVMSANDDRMPPWVAAKLEAGGPLQILS